jgi:hypothetical protein
MAALFSHIASWSASELTPRMLQRRNGPHVGVYAWGASRLRCLWHSPSGPWKVRAALEAHPTGLAIMFDLCEHYTKQSAAELLLDRNNGAAAPFAGKLASGQAAAKEGNGCQAGADQEEGRGFGGGAAVAGVATIAAGTRSVEREPTYAKLLKEVVGR